MMKNLLYAIIIAALSLSSCMEKVDIEPKPDNGEVHYGDSIAVDFSLRSPDGYTITKSAALGSTSESAITSVLAVVYRKNGSSYIYDQKTNVPTPFTTFSLDLTAGSTYRIDIYANYPNTVGSIDWSSNTASSLANTSLYSSTASYGMAKAGLPMTGTLIVSPTASTSYTIQLTRRVAKIGVKVNSSNCGDATYTFKGVQLKQANCQLPLSTTLDGYSAASASCCVDGDCASSADLSKIANGEEVFFYALQNQNGNLLPNNNNPWNKTPSSLASVYQNKVTYLEIDAEYSYKGLNAENAYMRMCIGTDNVKNFDVNPNYIYHITVYPSEKGILDGSWKIEADEIVSSRSLTFSKTDFNLVGPSSTTVTITPTPSDLAYNISYDEAQFASAGVTLTKSGNTITLTHDGEHNVSGLKIYANDIEGYASGTCTFNVAPPVRYVLEATELYDEEFPYDFYPATMIQYTLRRTDGIQDYPINGDITISSTLDCFTLIDNEEYWDEAKIVSKTESAGETAVDLIIGCNDAPAAEATSDKITIYVNGEAVLTQDVTLHDIECNFSGSLKNALWTGDNCYIYTNFYKEVYESLFSDLVVAAGHLPNRNLANKYSDRYYEVEGEYLFGGIYIDTERCDLNYHVTKAPASSAMLHSDTNTTITIKDKKHNKTSTLPVIIEKLYSIESGDYEYFASRSSGYEGGPNEITMPFSLNPAYSGKVGIEHNYLVFDGVEISGSSVTVTKGTWEHDGYPENGNLYLTLSNRYLNNGQGGTIYSEAMKGIIQLQVTFDIKYTESGKRDIYDRNCGVTKGVWSYSTNRTGFVDYSTGCADALDLYFNGEQLVSIAGNGIGGDAGSYVKYPSDPYFDVDVQYLTWDRF